MKPIPMSTPCVATIIVNFRTPKLTIDAVRSVLDEPETAQVIVVDNASGDDSEVTLRSGLPDDPRVELIVAGENRGFGAGNNLGARAATAPILFLLNSDALLHAGSMRLLVAALEEHPEVGIVAPRLLLQDGTEQSDAYGAFPTVLSIARNRLPAARDPLHPDWVTGAAMMMRRSEFLDLGGFDERIFMYGEDSKLCSDYARRGLGTIRVPEAKVTHLVGQSRTSSEAQRAQHLAGRDILMRSRGTPQWVLNLIGVGRRLNDRFGRRLRR